MIKQAKFVTSVANKNDVLNFNKPEIAIAGKSNVGKSSLINFLCNQKKLAKTSSEPGRTRLLNYFEINNGEYYFVDLPGYGFAKVSKGEKIKWGDLIEGYFNTTKNLKNVFVLIDIRHDPTEDDLIMINYLYQTSLPFTIIATKSDKLSKQQIAKSLKTIAGTIKVGIQNIIVTSVLNRVGKEEVEKRIEQILISSNKPIEKL